MKRGMVSVTGIVCMMILLTGRQKTTETCSPYRVENKTFSEKAPAEISAAEEPSEPKASSANEGFDAEGTGSGIPAESRDGEERILETAPEQTNISDIRGALSEESPAENQGDTAEQDLQNVAAKVRNGAIKQIFDSSDIPPEDTVKYTESQKEEIQDTQYVESVIDENDPNTYQIVEKEKEVLVRYMNRGGDIKYAYEDGVWYEYKYSSGNVKLGVKDEAKALAYLDMLGDYEGFEVVSIDCTETVDGDNNPEYLYSVRYRSISAMDHAPSSTENLAKIEEELTVVTAMMPVKEMVPVLLEETVGTGEYRYYGWQEQDGEVCYYDENAERVTGSQVIQGLRCEFDENGVKTSRTGVEVSENNGEIDWESVALAGVDYVIVQCAYRESAEGVLTLDARAEENIRGAQQAGLDTGISLFSQAVTVEEAEEEAKLLINLARKYGITFPIAVTASYANPEHNGRADGLGREERTDYIAVCCRTLQSAGYTPVLHAEASFLSDCLNMDELGGCQLWLTQCDSNLTYTGPYEIWQYTARGTIEGISGYTGLNISYGK